MTLDEWRLRRGLTYRELGTLIGCYTTVAFCYCQRPGAGQFKLPGAERMAAIFRLTGGAVAPADFYSLPRLAPRADGYTAPELPLPGPDKSRRAA